MNLVFDVKFVLAIMPELAPALHPDNDSEYGSDGGDYYREDEEMAAAPSKKGKSSKPKLKKVSSHSTTKGAGGRSSKSADKIALHKRLGLHFPVARVKRYLRAGKFASRVSLGAAVFASAVLDYLVSELIHIAIEKAQSLKRTRVKPRHIQLAIRDDLEFYKLLSGVVVSEGGGYPLVHEVLRGPRKHAKKSHNDSGGDDDEAEGDWNAESQEFGED